MCGLEVGEKEITIDPVDIGLKYFKLDGIKIRGHKYSVQFSRDKDRENLGLKKGFAVIRDGEIVFRSGTLAKTILEF